MGSRLLFQSFVWLAGCSGIGYLCYLATGQGEAEIAALKEKFQTESANKPKSHSDLFTSTLQSATSSSKPLYRMTKEEIEQLIKNNKK